MLQWRTVGVVAVICMVINGQSNDAVDEVVFCPRHTQLHIDYENKTYRACQPHLCIPQDPDDPNSTPNCPHQNQSGRFLGKLLSPSCQWVRLYRDHSYNFSSNNDGSIYDWHANVTHRLGEYVYHSIFQEAYICREKLLVYNDTEDITLWCSSHTIHMTEYPTELDDGYENYKLHLPHLNLTVPPGFYQIHNKTQGFKVNVCLKTSLEFMLCELKITLNPSVTQFEVLSNLSLLVNWKKPIAFPVGQYYLSADDGSAIVCREPDEQLPDFYYYIYPLYIVSAVFLLFTLLAHLFYPKLNYHAKALLCCIVSMMVMYICFTFKTHYFQPRTATGRFLLFGFYYVSSMSTYLWLSVLSYDLWKIFTNLRGSSKASSYVNDKKLWFAMKCVYAWGIPLVIYFLIIGLSHDNKAAEYLGLHLVNGPHSFIMETNGLFIFMYGPLIVILMANTSFCGLTIWNIYKARKGSKLNDKFSMNLFYVCVKLFVVMGISWLSDVIAFLSPVSSRASYVFIVINALQGVAIFLVYVCKQSHWRMIKRKWMPDDGSSETRDTGLSRGPLTSTSGGHSNKPN